MVLKSTQPMGDVIGYAAAGKNCAFNTQHLPPPMIHRLTGHEMTSNLRGCMLHCSESARYQVWGSLMLCGRSSRSRRESLTYFWTIFFQTEMGPISVRKKKSRNGSGSDVSNDNCSHTASTTLKIGRKYSQSSGAYGLEGLTSSRSL